MKYLIDANICIRLLDTGSPNLKLRVQACDEGDLAISAIAFAEVAHGSARGKPPPKKILDRFVDEVPVLPFDQAAASRYAELLFVRGSFDRLIAAHALSLGVTIITNNEADFAGIPGLKIENWTLA